MKNKLWFFLFLILVLICPYNNLQAKNNAQIQSLRIWPSPGSVRVVFDLNQTIDYKIQTLTNPYRVVVDFENAQLVTKVSDVSLKSTQITQVRHGNYENKIRIVFETSSSVKPNSFVLTPNEYYGHRLVLDLESSEKQEILALFDLDELQESQKEPEKELQAEQKIIINSPKNFIVAIDAGHGGEDPGAVGPRGTQEKVVVLAIAKELQSLINKQKGMRAFLTCS